MNQRAEEKRSGKVDKRKDWKRVASITLLSARGSRESRWMIFSYLTLRLEALLNRRTLEGGKGWEGGRQMGYRKS